MDLKDKEIPRQLELLEKEISTLDEVVSSLLASLVIATSKEEDTPLLEQSEEILRCEYGETLRNKRKKIESIRLRVTDLIERLQF